MVPNNHKTLSSVAALTQLNYGEKSSKDVTSPQPRHLNVVPVVRRRARFELLRSLPRTEACAMPAFFQSGKGCEDSPFCYRFTSDLLGFALAWQLLQDFPLANAGVALAGGAAN
jgi:hypothetical protein